MDRLPKSVDALRLYLQNRIDGCTTRIALARKAASAPRRRGTPRRQTDTGPDMAQRRAYRDALRALNAIPSDNGAPAALRLAAEELDRIKSALARIYEVTQHANHDIAAAGDWAIVEGEAQAALNVMHEVERKR
jgi:hypothetical protein